MQQDKPLRRLGYHSGACKGLLARSPARRQTLPSDQPPLPAGLPRPRLHVTTRYVCQDPPSTPRRRRSAWRRRREIHSRTPYPSANPMVRAIVRSSIRVRTATALETITKLYLP